MDVIIWVAAQPFTWKLGKILMDLGQYAYLPGHK
jgi:hypothetical protein